MYKKTDHSPELPEVALYFEGRLSPDNRWIKLAERLPWEELEEDYAKHFDCNGRGEVALSVRVAMGALIIKEILGTSDRGTVDAIIENPYLQYFLGFKSFQSKPPFDASLMTHFRKRFSADIINKFNEKVIEKTKTSDKTSKPDDSNPPPSREANTQHDETTTKNKGTILMDATCAPADIKYPTDLNLINDSRELSEVIIDKLRKLSNDKNPRPRTKTKICRKRFLEIVKHSKCGVAKRRKALRFLLNALRRNLKFIDEYLVNIKELPENLKDQIATIKTIHNQQREMLEKRTRRVADRIVNLHQPHVRPIVRGKAGHETEFGAKLTVSLTDGYARVERLSWDAYSEAGDLKVICERFKERTGNYPEAILADKLFRNRENLRYCAELNIRLSGPKLGRPTKTVDPEILKQEWADNSARNAIEGKFGQCKRRLGMGLVMTRLKDSSETMISLTILVANLIKWDQELTKLFSVIFSWQKVLQYCYKKAISCYFKPMIYFIFEAKMSQKQYEL